MEARRHTMAQGRGDEGTREKVAEGEGSWCSWQTWGSYKRVVPWPSLSRVMAAPKPGVCRTQWMAVHGQAFSRERWWYLGRFLTG